MYFCWWPQNLKLKTFLFTNGEEKKFNWQKFKCPDLCNWENNSVLKRSSMELESQVHSIWLFKLQFWLRLSTLWEPKSDGAAATFSLLKTTQLPPLLKLKPVQYSPGKKKPSNNIGNWPSTVSCGVMEKDLNSLLMMEEMQLYSAFTVNKKK